MLNNPTNNPDKNKIIKKYFNRRLTFPRTQTKSAGNVMIFIAILIYMYKQTLRKRIDYFCLRMSNLKYKNN